MIKRSAIILLFIGLQITAFAQQTYKLDVKKSKILWNNRKTMGGHYGYVMVKAGTLTYTPEGEPKDGVFSIDMNSMRATDNSPEKNEKVNNELRTAGFFNIDKYPEATMVVKQISRIGKTTNYTVSGDLTIKGTTNPIAFIATIIKKGDVITATGKPMVNRIAYYIDMQPEKKSWDWLAAAKNKMIADEILVTLNLVFTK